MVYLIRVKLGKSSNKSQCAAFLQKRNEIYEVIKVFAIQVVKEVLGSNVFINSWNQSRNKEERDEGSPHFNKCHQEHQLTPNCYWNYKSKFVIKLGEQAGE